MLKNIIHRARERNPLENLHLALRVESWGSTKKNGKIKDLVLNCTIFLPPPLGKGPATKLDEFLEKFQTAFDPPPLIFRKLHCNFFRMDMLAYMTRSPLIRNNWRS